MQVVHKISGKSFLEFSPSCGLAKTELGYVYQPNGWVSVSTKIV